MMSKRVCVLERLIGLQTYAQEKEALFDKANFNSFRNQSV
jgi:hypothetical protein